MKPTSNIVSRMSICAAVAVSAAAALAAGNTWWVDASNYGAAGRDGSEQNPFGSIHEAVSSLSCVAGDTIKVKPGVYD